MREFLTFFLFSLVVAPDGFTSESFNFSIPAYSHRYDYTSCVNNRPVPYAEANWDSRLELSVKITPNLESSPDSRFLHLNYYLNSFHITMEPTPKIGFVSARTQLEGPTKDPKLVGIQRRLPYSDVGASRMVLGTFVHHKVDPYADAPCDDPRNSAVGSIPFRYLIRRGYFDLVLDPEVEQTNRVLGPGRCVHAPCQVNPPFFLIPNFCVQYQRSYEMTFTNRSTRQSMRFIGSQTIENTHREASWQNVEDCEAFKAYMENR